MAQATLKNIWQVIAYLERCPNDIHNGMSNQYLAQCLRTVHNAYVPDVTNKKKSDQK